MSEVLYLKYRPRKFDNVVGQDAVVKSLQRVIEKGTAHSFLLAGPSGCGKTTLARIAAKAIGCKSSDILEIDAATNTGIDAMRAITEGLKYKPLGTGMKKALLIDECHALSKAAWQSLLKAVEEPPSHVYWFFCTTEVSKVPQTIKTRCSTFTLKDVEASDLRSLVNRVVKAEGLSVGDDVLKLVVAEAGGSPRQALVNLALCDGVKSRSEAADLLKSAIESEPVIALCRGLYRPQSWAKTAALVAALGDTNPESVRIIVSNYFAKVLIGAKSDREATHFLNVLEAFSTPFNSSDKLAPVLLACGRVLFNG